MEPEPVQDGQQAECEGTSRVASPSGACSSIPVDDVKEHLTCGLCGGPFAHSLVLTCSHLFCGDCLLKRLQQEGISNTKQTCPTCNMDLRAVPVRCLAMDKVAAAIVPSLSQEQQQQYTKRCRDGQTAADQINKMLWWLTPANMAGPLAAAGGPSTPTAALHPANMLGGAFGSMGGGISMAMAANPSILGGLDPKASSALPAPFGALGAAAAAAAAAHQAPFPPGALPPFGGPLGAGHLGPAHMAGAGANPVLQMAMAAHMAQAQEAMRKQLQLNAPAAAAAAAAAANLHAPAFMPDMASLQQALLGQDRSAAAAALGGHLGGGAVPPAQQTGYTPDQQLQLSSLMASMCQV